MSALFTEMFGSSLLESKDKKVDTLEALKGAKAVGVLFSAHWCPPCRGFTPKVAEYYKKDLKSKGLEIVFVSSDQDQSAFDEYFGEQPWYALPYDERTLKNNLSKKFKVRGIPSFVILDGETGELITLEGRAAIMNDPTGEEFAKTKWTPPTFDQIFGDAFDKKTEQKEKKEGESLYETVTREQAFGKDVEAVALYFSAHWCGPCRSFTPKLIEAYNKINADKKRFEVVFCSADRDQKAYDDYFGTHPWLSIPFTDKKREGQLSSHFDCNGIPHLVILDAKNNFEIINANAVGKVHGDAEGKSFPWAPDMVKHIDSDPEGIDEGLSLVVLQENVDSKEQEENLEKILKPIAEKYKGKKLNDSEVIFFVANEEGRLANRVRDACSIDKESDKKKPQVVMMNIPDDSYYAFDSEELSKESIEKFFEDYKAGSLSTKPMGA